MRAPISSPRARCIRCRRRRMFRRGQHQRLAGSAGPRAGRAGARGRRDVPAQHRRAARALAGFERALAAIRLARHARGRRVRRHDRHLRRQLQRRQRVHDRVRQDRLDERDRRHVHDGRRDRRRARFTITTTIGAHTFDVITYPQSRRARASDARLPADIGTMPAFAGIDLVRRRARGDAEPGREPRPDDHAARRRGLARRSAAPNFTLHLNGTGPLVGIIGTLVHASRTRSTTLRAIRSSSRATTTTVRSTIAPDASRGRPSTMTPISLSDAAGGAGSADVQLHLRRTTVRRRWPRARKNKPNATYASGLTYSAQNYSTGTLGHDDGAVRPELRDAADHRRLGEAQPMRPRLLVLTLAATFALAACGGGGSTGHDTDAAGARDRRSGRLASNSGIDPDVVRASAAERSSAGRAAAVPARAIRPRSRSTTERRWSTSRTSQLDSTPQFETVYAKSGSTTVTPGTCSFTSASATCPLTSPRASARTRSTWSPIPVSRGHLGRAAPRRRPANDLGHGDAAGVRRRHPVGGRAFGHAEPRHEPGANPRPSRRRRSGALRRTVRGAVQHVDDVRLSDRGLGQRPDRPAGDLTTTDPSRSPPRRPAS